MTERLRLASQVTFRSFASHNFRLFFGGQLVSQVGTWMQLVTVAWLVLELTGSGVAIGLVTGAQFFPLLVLGAWAGVLADRLDRHHLMIATQAAFLLVAAALAALTLTDHITVAGLFVLSLVFGVINAVDNPSRRALVVELVPEDDVANAVGLNSALMTGSRVIGPAVAGVLIAGPGAGICFLVNAVTYVPVIAALLRLDRSQFRPMPRVAKAKGQLRAGLRYLWETPELRLPIILMAVVGTLVFNYQVTLPLLAERTFGGSASTFTLLFSTLSLGSVAGALTVARRSSVDLGFLVRAGIGLAVTTLALALAPTLPLALLASLAVGFCNLLMISGSTTVVQLRSAPAMRGRMLALLSVVFLGSKPIGGPIVGSVAELAGVRSALALGGVAMLLALAWTVHQMRTRPGAEAGAAAKVEPAAA
ncbi:MAG TPA: MFS transporter [Acidimicrobiales bacterium]|jgi:MFS family permease|nr:MFS transporter [Acidimicrobiales bacterium]